MKWKIPLIFQEALKYKTRTEFQQKSKGAYKAALRNGILAETCLHMPIRVDISGEKNILYKWTYEKLFAEALKYKTKTDFKDKSESAYQTAHKRGILNELCSHMSKYTRKGEQNPRFVWTYEMLRTEALKYDFKQEFRNNNYAAYLACKRRGLLEELCSHTKPVKSLQERELFLLIKSMFPSAKKLRDMKVKISRRPYIRGFE